MNMRRALLLATVTLVASGLTGMAQTTGTPVPRPFPGAPAPPGPSAPRTPPATTPAPAPTQPAAPVVDVAPAATAPEPAPAGPDLGVPIYPTADYLDSIDAGSGQQYHLYGTSTSYSEIVAYYRTVLKTGGREIYRTPGTYQFELGRFDDDRMAYPPSVVVKDYAGEASGGYLFPSGTTEKRYPTIIQIVPPAPGR